MKLTVDQFVAVVRALPLSANQQAAADAAVAAAPTNELPKELIRREVLTEFQVRQLLAGRGADLVVGRYLLLSELGAGGMGTVFKARDTAMDRVVALKLIRDERLANAGALARFQQEVRAAARLAHPNIVRAYDAGTADGRHFLVTELITGHDLGHELARRGALPPGEACEYARQAAVGLQHAHENGLTHRDIKPSNLLFSTAERLVKVADFGLARVGDAGAGGLTTAETVIGTPDYIAPEQAISATAADIRSDLYSLGCTLYHFLTGHVPFPRDTAYAKLRAHEREEPPPLDDACPGLNPALVAVVQKLMAKNPAERFQTPLEVADALIPFCPKPSSSTGAYRPASVASRAAPPPLPASASGPVVIPTPVPSETIPEAFPVDEPPRAPKSNKVLAVAGIGGGVLALVVLIVVLTRGSVAVVPHPQQNQTNVNVTVPVSVTVNLDDWAKTREPGVTITLGDRVLKRTDFADPLSLPPGRYTLVAKKDGKDLEAREFVVQEGDAGKMVASRATALPDPPGAAGEVGSWTPGKAVTDVFFHPDGKRFTALYVHNSPYPRVPGGGGGIGPARLRIYSADVPTPVASGDTAYDSGRIAVLNTELGLCFKFSHKDDPPTAYTFNPFAGGHPAPASSQRPIPERHFTHLLTASADGTRLLWSLTNFDNSATVGTVHLEAVTAKEKSVALAELHRFKGTVACFDPTGRAAFVANGKALARHEGADWKPAAEYVGAADPITALAANGERVAAGDDAGNVVVWSVKDKKTVARAKGHTGRVSAIGFTADGQRFVTTSWDGTVRVWDAIGKELHQYKHDGPVYALALSPGGKRVLTGGADKTVRLWQLPP